MEAISIVKTAGALGLVLGLIAIIAIAARHFGVIGGGYGRRRDEKRLSVVETLTLDARRRVLLLRCDATEHLVLLGMTGEAVLSGRGEAGPPRAEDKHPLRRERGERGERERESEEPEVPMWRGGSGQRMAYRRDEPVLGPMPPRGR